MTYFNDTVYRVTSGNIVYASDLNNPLAALETGIASLVSDIQTSANIHYATDTGSADAYAVTLDPAPSAYSEGLMIWLKPANANTGASTLNVNSLGAIAIKQIGLVSLAAGDLPANFYVCLKYADGVFQIVSNVGSAATYAAASASSASSASASQTAAETAAAAAAAKTYNMIVNGGFQIWQRSTSSSGNGYVTADMWYIGTSSSSDFKSTRGFYPRINTFINIKSEVDGQEYLGLREGVELQESPSVTQIKGKMLTLSFRVKPGESGMFAFTRIRFVDTVASDTHAVVIDAIDTSTSLDVGSWNSVSRVFSVLVDKESTTKAIEVYFGVYKSGGVTSDIDSGFQDVKLEEGYSPTTFVKPNIGEELAKCQRFYRLRSTSGIDDYDHSPSMFKAATETGSSSPYAYSADI